MCNYCYGSESTHNKMGRISITTPECKHISICAGYGKAQPIKQVRHFVYHIIPRKNAATARGAFSLL